MRAFGRGGAKVLILEGDGTSVRVQSKDTTPKEERCSTDTTLAKYGGVREPTSA